MEGVKSAKMVIFESTFPDASVVRNSLILSVSSNHLFFTNKERSIGLKNIVERNARLSKIISSSKLISLLGCISYIICINTKLFEINYTM